MAARSRKSEDQPPGENNESPTGAGTAQAEPDGAQSPDITQLIGHELERQFLQAIGPVLTGLPDQIMGAIDPALGQLQESMARVVRQQAAQVLEITPSAAVAQTSGGARGEDDSPARSSTEPEAGHEEEPTALGHNELESPNPIGAVIQDTMESREGESSMADDKNKSKQSDSEDASDDQKATRSRSESRSQSQRRQRTEDAPQSRERSRGRTYSFDASAAARVGLLNLANTMKDYGATFQAINAYERILIRYPGTGAADAATEGLVDLAERLQKEGKIYTALSIFTKLEQLL